MQTLLERETREAVRQRIARLRPDTPARWGHFTAPRMLAHAIQSLGMMTGDVAVAPKRTPWGMRHWPLKHLLIYVLPFPKGLPTSPELLQRPAVGADVSDLEWADELRAFDRALDRIPEVARTNRWPIHPAFGALTGHEWAGLQARHLDHHLRQFGL